MALVKNLSSKYYLRVGTGISTHFPVNKKHQIPQLKGSVKEPNKFHNYETEKITRKASDAAEYIQICLVLPPEIVRRYMRRRA